MVNNKIKNTTNLKQLDLLKDSKNELYTRLQNKVIELNNVNQRIRDIEQCGETNSFIFNDIKQDDEIDLKGFLNLQNTTWLYSKMIQFTRFFRFL